MQTGLGLSNLPTIQLSAFYHAIQWKLSYRSSDIVVRFNFNTLTDSEYNLLLLQPVLVATGIQPLFA